MCSTKLVSAPRAVKKGMKQRLKMSGETCEVSGIYKAHCVHAIKRSFSEGQVLPRCEHCQFDILWALEEPESLEIKESPLVSSRVAS